MTSRHGRAPWVRRLLRCTVVAGLVARAAGQAAAQSTAVRISVDTIQMRADASVLAHDSMQGRGTGSPGEARAAAYIEQRLNAMGLVPLGRAFRLPLPLISFRPDPASTLIIRNAQDSASYRYHRDFFFDRGGREAFRGFEGRVIFAGLPENAAASLSNVEIRGAVIAVIGSLGAAALNLEPDWVERGATGVIEIVQDTAAFAGIRENLGPDRLALDAVVDDPVWQSRLPRLVVGLNVTGALFAGVSLPPEVFRGERFPALTLDSNVRLQPVLDSTRIAVSNVAGMIPGSDPDLAGSFVTFTAHYDHLGIGAADESGDSIYNGFTDNAAGVSMLLGIADALRRRPPARSVLFLFFTAEERGLLGSTWFVTDPPIALDRIAALINLDGGAPPRPPVEWRVAGIADSPISQVAGTIITELGWTPNLTATSPNSDHWPFLRRGVPSIFIIPGNTWENTSEPERLALRERWDHYHRPADTWTPDYPFAGIARYAELAARIGRRIADRRP